MPPHFTGLPQEIRDAILEMCLIVEGPINPFPTYYEDRNPFAKTDRKPDIALLTVNRSINAEASIIFYGANLWKLNWQGEDYSPIPETSEFEDLIRHLSSAPRSKIWFTRRAQIRHITLDLDMRDQNAKMLLYDTKREFERNPSEMRSAKRVEMIHDSRDMWLTFLCGFKLRIIRNMQLISACINIENLFCINGCCRLGLIRSACFEYLRIWARYVKPEPGRKIEGPSARAWNPEIAVVGLRNQDELTAGRQWWEEWYGTQLDYVTDMNGQRIGLKGFFDINERKPDCS